MKLNADCVREVLLSVESWDSVGRITPDKIHDMKPEFSEEEINYAMLKLDEAGLLQVEALPFPGEPVPQVALVKDITYAGHEFLAKIRPEKSWKAIINKIVKEGLPVTIEILKECAAGVVSGLLARRP